MQWKILYLIRLIYLSYFFNFRNIIVHIAIFPFNLLFLKGHCKYESIHKVNCYFFLFRKVHIKNVIYNKEITENCINFHREYIFWQFSTSKTYLLKCKSSTFQSSNENIEAGILFQNICNCSALTCKVCQYTKCCDFNLISPAVKVKSVKSCSNK